ncbi:MAG: primosomal protein N' [Moraxella sp.]|nr:primosomal protein N' [Moraxella sp.]
MPHLPLIQVALPTPLYRCFDYLCPDDVPSVGCRVAVPFGRQTLIGMVIAHSTTSDVPSHKLKAILSVIDETPIIDDAFLDFAKWLSGYYHYPLGETLAVMLPTLINQGKAPPQSHHLTAIALDDKTIKDRLKTAKKQREALAVITDNPAITDDSLATLGVSPSTINGLLAKGLIRQEPAIIATTPTVKGKPLDLTDEQSHALSAITDAINTDFKGFLLNGITGSGKTEVYLHAIAHALTQGKQVLVLVPEIGLTPQTLARFKERFCANIIIVHSGLNDKERLSGWQACRTGFAHIVIATRSGLFYPFKNLGLIIIDEAHDSSFKQQDHLRYHAPDVALYLGFCQKIPVVLGTATPSLEQYKLIHDGKLHEYKLTKRAKNAKPASFYLIDKRLGTMGHTDVHGASSQGELAFETVLAIRQTLERGEQVMVFLNRRGFSPILLCSSCGHQTDCVRCSSHLTLHKSNLKQANHPNASYLYDHLKCHHCGYQVKTPTHCPACRSPNLVSLGQGTSGLFEQLHALFANPQKSPIIYPIHQIDRDTLVGKGAWESLYADINTARPMILIGTQMIAKGHHFENVTLVVVADADMGFLSPNFRSPEHTAQTIMQVAGRAGRAGKAGRVLIQTYNPQNPTLQTLIKDGYERFAHELLKERQELGLPPYSHAVLIKADARSHDMSKNAIIHAKAHLDSFGHDFAVLAPIDAPLLKKNNRYHVQMLILAKHRPTLHQVLDVFWEQALALPTSKGVHLTIDIDPVGW